MPASRVRAVAIASLVLLSLLFWKLRIVDTGVSPMFTLYSADLFTQHWPMTEYAFSTMRQGRLPLWNPWQLCGEPFLAIPYVGVFYPINLIYLFLSVPAGIEVDTIVHLTIGLLGMWALMRHFGVSHLSAVTSAATFAWSGWLVYNVNQPSLFAGLSWMPWTVLAVDALCLGTPLAWLAVLLLVGVQVLRGSVEILIHALTAASIFAAMQLFLTWRRQGLVTALGRGALLGVAIGGGLALAAIQIAPTSELVGLSSRAAGSRFVSFEVARLGGLAWPDLARAAVASGPSFMATIGLFPVLAAVLLLGGPLRRCACAAAFVCIAVAVALIPGDEAYRLYHSLPIVGDVFRRPMKFLDIFSLGAAVLVGLAVARLQDWRNTPASALLREPALLGALLLAAILLLYWPWSSRLTGLAFASLAVLIAAFAAVPSPQVRSLVVGAICLVQGASAFYSVSSIVVRPLWRTDTFASFRPALRPLLALPPQERTYLFPAEPAPFGWNMKQGMVNRFGVAEDYESLVVARYAEYFDRITPEVRWIEGFVGFYNLEDRSAWPLMLATGTRYFAALANTPADARLASGRMPPNGPSFRRVADGPVRLYAADAARPRAYVVGQARLIAKPRVVLNVMQSPRAYELRREVLLEDAPESLLGDLGGDTIKGNAEITSYEPERVVVRVDTSGTGMLVLTDLFYPGWRAFLDDDEVPIYRGNYLFRTVLVPGGRHEVRFEYRPGSFRRGLATSAITAIAVAIAAVSTWRRRRLWRPR